MLKKLMAIILVLELGLMYLPEKYIFAIEDDPQAETEEITSEEPTIPTIPEMSGIEENPTPTEPVTDVIPEEAPAEAINKIEPQNDLPSADKWFVFNETTNTITGYSSSTSAPKNINIPSTIGGIPVYNIADNAFAGQQLTGLTLPNGLKTIGNNAFQNNPNMLGDLVIPDSVTSMGEGAFQSCRGLTGVVIGNGVTGIMDYTFDGCEKITSAVIGNNVTSIGNFVFTYCQFTTSIVIPDSVTSIAQNAFPKSNAPSINIPGKNEGEIAGEPWGAYGVPVYWKGVEQIGDYLFNTTTNTILKYTGTVALLDIPSAFTVNGISYPVKIIDNRVFKNNTALTNVTIPDSVTSFGEYAFSGCSSLTTVVIGNGITSIGSESFSNCSNLSTVVIGNGVTSIGNSAFYNCSSLTGVVIPNSVTSIRDSAFQNCSSLTGIVIPSSVTLIGDSAFVHCSNLTTVTIHGSGSLEIKKYYNSPYRNFEDCVKLQKIDLLERLKGSVKGSPWGATSSTNVYWKDHRQAGDFDFDPVNNTIIKYKGVSKIVDIPSTLTVDGISYPVKKIGDEAFSYRGITNVIIPNSVIGIGNSAFGSCRSLTGIVIPNSVTSIGNSVFSNCEGLTSATIGNSVKSIPYNAFNCCGKLTSIVIPDSVTSIGEQAFYGCSGLTGVTIGNGVIGIGNSAFSFCSGLASITIGNSVTSIGNSAFSKCNRLIKIDIPSKNEGEINGAPWAAPYAIVYWKGVEQTGDYTFNTTTNTITNYIGSATTLTIPGTLIVDGISYPVQKIGNKAFYQSINLKSITIPDSVTSIDSRVFNSGYLKSIYITGKNEGDISGAPWGASDYTIVYWKGVVLTGDYAFNTITNTITKYIGSATTLTIPSTLIVDGISYPVKKIGDKAFYGNTSLTNVTIPDSVTGIGEHAFYQCSNLTGVTIGNSVASIGKSAFSGCKALTGIVIPNSVTSIGEMAFYTCSGLTSVTIGNGVTVIGNSAFSYCSGLAGITIGNSVTSIGNYAFQGCSNLTGFVIPDSVTSIGEMAFYGCSGFTSCTIGNGITGIKAHTFEGCSGLTNIVIPDCVTNIEDSAFQSCSGLTSVTIGNGVTDIGNSAFDSCSGLINVTIPDNVINIGSHAFQNCSGLTNVTIGNGVTEIGNSAFDSCSGLTVVTIGNGVTTIGAEAFRTCSNLTTVTIHGSKYLTIKETTPFNRPWHYYNFDGCPKLQTIDFPDRLKESVHGAPWGAPSDTNIYYKDYRKAGDYMFDPTSGTIIQYIGGAKIIDIPSTMITDGISYPVKKIGGSAFYHNHYISSITIPDSVTSIENYAFDYALKIILLPGRNEGEISGAPWGAPYAAVCWANMKQIGDYAFDFSKNTLMKYLGTDPVVTIPSYFTLDDTDYPVKALGNWAFYNCNNITKITIPDNVTIIGKEAFQSCESLTSIVIPDSVISIGDSAFYKCSALTEAVISKNIASMPNDIFYYCPVLQTIYMRGSRSGLPISVTSAQPWGAVASSTVHYAGDIVTFDHTVKKVTGKYNRILDIRAFLNKPALINRIMLPNGTIKYVAKSDWPNETGYYPYGNITEEAITSNGTYVFKGYGDDNVEQAYTVEINDIGIITLRANEASITEQMAPTASEQDVLDLFNVSAEDDAGVLTSGTDCTFWISPEDMNKIHALHLGDVVTIRVNVKSSRSGKEMTSYRDVTLNTTSCVIHADNVDLWPVESKVITKQQLLDLMHASVVDSEGTADMTKLDIADADFNKIKIGTPGIYNVLLTYDTNKSKKRVRVTIMDDSPAALIKIPSEIKMKEIKNDFVYGVGAEETVSIQPFTNTTLYPNPFKIETDPSFWLKSTAPGATVFNQMKVVVLDANDQPLPDNHLLATLSGTTIQSAPFKLRGYHDEWNSVGTYSGIMNFLITYEEPTP